MSESKARASSLAKTIYRRRLRVLSDKIRSHHGRRVACDLILVLHILSPILPSRRDLSFYPMSARAEVEALLAIIKESAFNALDEYEKHGQPLPSLDSLEAHPLDRAENKLDLKKIIRTLQGACEQLCSTVAQPTQTILNRAQDYTWACLRVVIKHKIADELAKHEGGLHIDELAKTVNIHPRKLASILRILATKHCFREVAPDVFTNNRLSINLLSTNSVSSVVEFSTDRHEYAQTLPEYLVDPQVGQSIKVNEAPFQYAIKNQGHGDITFYEWIELVSNRHRREVMGKAMIGVNDALGSLSAVHVYPWGKTKTICDVGSGIGAFSRALLKENDHVQVTLFDLPHTMENTKLHWKNDFADRVTYVGGDFFQEIPVKGCDLYYVRNVLHNWTDEKAVRILQSVRAAMGSQSRVLVHDPVRRHLYPVSGPDDDGLDKAPAPLLPNYGAGQIQLYSLDISMMILFNSKERTITEITKIAQAAGLRLLNVYDMAETCLLELGKLEA